MAFPKKQRQQRGPREQTVSVQDGRTEPDDAASPAARERASDAAPGDAPSAPPMPSRFDSLAQGSAAGAVGNNIYPLFCMSVFEHAWLGDYGFWGKERYTTNFWNALNWERVERLWGEDRV